MPWLATRPRHFDTLGSDIPSEAAIAAVVWPSAAISAILARMTSRCGAVLWRSNASSALRSFFDSLTTCA